MKKYFYTITIIISFTFNSFCYAQVGNIYTLAGTGVAGFSGDGGLASAAQLNQPTDVFKDRLGNIYIADKGNHRIRKVDASGIITTIVGTGTAGYTGDGGAAISATLTEPNRVVVDTAGNIYIADKGNYVIRKVNTAGIITTVAGNGTRGFSGDGGLAINAQLNDPTGVAVDFAGNFYISDNGTNRIRKVNTAGIITTYAGGGSVPFTYDGVPATSVSLCRQNYVSIDDSGTIYFTNWSCWHFLKVTTDGLMYNVAGNIAPSYSGDCGPASSANILLPFGICPDNLGNIYLTPQGNIRIRKVNPFNYISTVAGTGVMGYTGDGGPATNATISFIAYGIYADKLGNVYFADQGNHAIRNFTTITYVDSFVLCIGTSDTIHNITSGSKWFSKNSAIATVDSVTGIIKAMSPGTTFIYNNAACPELIFVKVEDFPDAGIITGPTAICIGYSITLENKIVGGVWSAANNTIANISSSGVVMGYAPGVTPISYAVTNSCGTATSTKNVIVSPNDSNFYTTDTLICYNNLPAILNVDGGYDTYIWNTGGIDSFKEVANAGVYVNTAAKACAVRVHKFKITIGPLFHLSLGNDTAFCIGDSLTLSALQPGSNSYIWSTGSTNPVISVSDVGMYWAKVTDAYACSVADTVLVSMNTIPVVQLGPDTILCNGEILVLSTGNVPSVWSTGTFGTDITINNSGNYWAFQKNQCAEISDTVNVNYEDCNFFFPSAFTPNGDGHNDVARARGSLLRFSDYSLKIYNRYGQCVFYTTDIFHGWDGAFNGENQDAGVYYYTVYYKYTKKSSRRTLQGDLTLIR